jgi:hypothetical protein
MHSRRRQEPNGGKVQFGHAPGAAAPETRARKNGVLRITLSDTGRLFALAGLAIELANDGFEPGDSRLIQWLIGRK